MNLSAAVRKHGVIGVGRAAFRALVSRPYFRWRWRNAPRYQEPNPAQIDAIEASLEKLGVRVARPQIDRAEFAAFKERMAFPADYHGGQAGGLWDEKMFEHFLAFRLGGLDRFRPDDVYIDVAGCSSPWAHILRDHGTQAYSIDLSVRHEFQHLPYYEQQDATRTRFGDASVRACSLQCAFEMFAGDDDCRLIDECARILVRGGKLVIAPLYLHTHHCGYVTPDFFGGTAGDPGAPRYLCTETWAVPYARIYSPDLLKRRILNRAADRGLHYEVSRVTGLAALGQGLYCHFVLVITKP